MTSRGGNNYHRWSRSDDGDDSRDVETPHPAAMKTPLPVQSMGEELYTKARSPMARYIHKGRASALLCSKVAVLR